LKLVPKSLREIVENCQTMIHRYRRRWLKKNLRPCPDNCKLADVIGRRVIGCEGCGVRNPDQCILPKKFEPLYTKEELYQQFRERIRNPEILLRDYRDIAALLWVLGGFDTEELDETLLQGVEKHEINVAGSDAGDHDSERGGVDDKHVAPPSQVAIRRPEINGNK
jgi:hypothetical protein